MLVGFDPQAAYNPEAKASGLQELFQPFTAQQSDIKGPRLA
jgi:hypothetical protein